MTANVVAKNWGSLHTWADGSKRSYPEPTAQALRFPSNIAGDDKTAPYVAIKFANPQFDGYPPWGPADSGVTILRRIKVAQQTGYYAQYWWTQDDGNFGGLSGDDHPYYGAHPYPTTQNNTGTSHIWEIAVRGGDFFDNAGTGTIANGTSVIKEQWYTQALRVIVNGDGTKTFRFWYDILGNPATFIERTEPATYGASLAAVNWAVVIGDSPWFAGYQHERASMDLASIKIIMDALSDADVASEAADMSQLVTAAAQAGIWWGKTGFSSVDDLTCDYGTARTFVWADAANKGTLATAG